MIQEYRRQATSASLINYRLTWCPKYRRQVLGSPVKMRLETLIGEVTVELDCEVLALEVIVDHVHLFLNCPRLKDGLGPFILREYLHIKQYQQGQLLKEIDDEHSYILHRN